MTRQAVVKIVYMAGCQKLCGSLIHCNPFYFGYLFLTTHPHVLDKSGSRSPFNLMLSLSLCRKAGSEGGSGPYPELCVFDLDACLWDKEIKISLGLMILRRSN